MFLEILFFALLGIGAGIFTGLVPGIHVNTVVALLLASLPFLAGWPPHSLATFVISLAVTHTLLDFIPSIFLGAPESATALSVLPGHKLLLKGRGLHALYLAVIGGVGVVLLLILLAPILLVVLLIFYQSIKLYILWILLAIVAILIWSEPVKRRGWTLLIFFLAGLLGLVVLNSILIQSTTLVFFPLFTGLFGIPILLQSIRRNPSIPPQESSYPVSRKLAISGVGKGFCSGLLVGILPGVGAAQAGILAQILTGKHGSEEFLCSTGGINTANSQV